MNFVKNALILANDSYLYLSIALKSDLVFNLYSIPSFCRILCTNNPLLVWIWRVKVPRCGSQVSCDCARTVGGLFLFDSLSLPCAVAFTVSVACAVAMPGSSWALPCHSLAASTAQQFAKHSTSGTNAYALSNWIYDNLGSGQHSDRKSIVEVWYTRRSCHVYRKRSRWFLPRHPSQGSCASWHSDNHRHWIECVDDSSAKRRCRASRHYCLNNSRCNN